MNIDSPLRELGPIDNSELSDAIMSLDESVWKENLTRQEEFEVHRATESVVMYFVDLDQWPNVEVTKESGFKHLSNVALPLMNDIISRCYQPGGTVIRAMAAKLLAGKKIIQHWDKHPSFHCGHRIHVPITTNPRVRFMIDGQPYRFKIGEAYDCLLYTSPSPRD